MYYQQSLIVKITSDDIISSNPQIASSDESRGYQKRNQNEHYFVNLDLKVADEAPTF